MFCRISSLSFTFNQLEIAYNPIEFIKSGNIKEIAARSQLVGEARPDPVGIRRGEAERNNPTCHDVTEWRLGVTKVACYRVTTRRHEVTSWQVAGGACSDHNKPHEAAKQPIRDSSRPKAVERSRGSGGPGRSPVRPKGRMTTDEEDGGGAEGACDRSSASGVYPRMTHSEEGGLEQPDRRAVCHYTRA